MTAEQEIRRYGYEVQEGAECPVDIEITDGEVQAWARGELDDYHIHCEHPVIEYGDSDERGECLMCGATCDWHYELDACSVEDYHWEGKERVPHEWYEGEGGLIKQYIEENY